MLNFKFTVIWDVTPCSFLDRCRQMRHHFHCETHINFVLGIKFYMPLNYEVYFTKLISHSINFHKYACLQSRFAEILLTFQ